MVFRSDLAEMVSELLISSAAVILSRNSFDRHLA
jgi:hypothetical protein